MLAIVIPYYKIEFFKETLHSLASQTNKGFNVYVGNDNSPNNPEKIIAEFNKNLPIYYKKFDKNLGQKSLPQHWDRCISLTKNEKWILVLGDDDLLENNAVELWYKEKEDKTNLYKFSSQMLYTDEKRFSEVYTHPQYEHSVDAFYRKFKGKTRSSLSEYIFKKTIYEKVGFKNYPLGWHSDDKAWLDFSFKEQIKTINDAKVIIRVSSISISGNKNNLKEKNDATIQFYKDFCKDHIEFLPVEKRTEILSFMEKLIVNNNLLTPHHIYFLLKLHYANLGFNQFFKFVVKRKMFLKALISKKQLVQ